MLKGLIDVHVLTKWKTLTWINLSQEYFKTFTTPPSENSKYISKRQLLLITLKVSNTVIRAHTGYVRCSLAGQRGGGRRVAASLWLVERETSARQLDPTQLPAATASADVHNLNLLINHNITSLHVLCWHAFCTSRMLRGYLPPCGYDLLWNLQGLPATCSYCGMEELSWLICG